jgi:hypothetical protein
MNVFKVSKHLNYKYQKQFCNSSCSASFNNKKRIVTDKHKQRISATAKKRFEMMGPWGALNDVTPITKRQCVKCGIAFLPPKNFKKRKTCSKECYLRYKRENMPTGKGGYRQGSGRSKHGFYKGIYCGSTYELCWVIYNLDHNIKFTRFPTFLEGNGIKYYPDFLLDDKQTIVETKGYESDATVCKKTKLAESYGYKVVVLRKQDLEPVFNYVKKTYGTSKYHTLYDT